MLDIVFIMEVKFNRRKVEVVKKKRYQNMFFMEGTNNGGELPCFGGGRIGSIYPTTYLLKKLIDVEVTKVNGTP